tara:strand:- start:331 stop:912 length:582 start_codon:yes stop_codon:yes gene_type:complete
MQRTWSSLGVDHYLSSVSWNVEELTRAILSVGYALLAQEKYEDAYLLIASARRAELVDPWLADCEARALLFQGKSLEAIAIWQSLLAGGDERMESNCQRMLSYAGSFRRKLEDEYVRSELLNAHEDMGFLLDLWTQYPESLPLEHAVYELIRSRLSLEDPEWSFIDSSIQDHLVALEAQVAWLASLQSWRSDG